MFGYVKPDTAELLVREHEFYRATYCGICRAMKKHTGALSNVSLSYDSVLLALTRMCFVSGDKIRAVKRRCIAHPVRRRGMLSENEAIEYTARAFALFTYYKLCDDIADKKPIERTAYRALKPISASAKRRAGLLSLSEIMKTRLDKITELEKMRVASIDAPAEIFGELLGEVFAHELTGDNRKIFYTFGYHLGKFIYAADAAEDYEKDYKSGSYNPYVLLYGTPEMSEENKSTVYSALLLECRGIEGAFNLMPFGGRKTIEGIVGNIIYLGLKKRIGFLTEKSEKEIDD